MGRKLGLKRMFAAASVLALAAAGAAHGQVVEEVVVTAQKRA